MKRTQSLALSLALAIPLVTTTVVSSSAASENCTSCSSESEIANLQPGRLETAREIKQAADQFVLRGRDLSKKLNERIGEAELLSLEARRLQNLAQQLSLQGLLIAQQPSGSIETQPVSGGTPPGAQESGDVKPTNIQGSDAKPADVKADEAKPSDSKVSDTKSGDTKKDEKLSGRASQLQTVAPPNIPLIRLKGPAFQQALRQFNADVEAFKVHAAEYNKHLNLFRSQVGECQAAKEAFNDLHKKYEMHCDAYHLNNIPPPHLCLEMNVSASEASGIANQLMNDQMRALRAEAQLRNEEGKLRELEGMQGKADNLVVKATDRARREREIAGMFGRLRQEYDLLEIERKTIDASRSANGKSASPVVRPYVSGKVKKAK